FLPPVETREWSTGAALRRLRRILASLPFPDKSRRAANSLPDYSQTASPAPRILIHRGAKFGGGLPQPFVALASRTSALWRGFWKSVCNHRQHCGDCLGPANPAR